MLPILISEAVSIKLIIGILAIKFVLGMFYGFLIDFIVRRKDKEEEKIVDLCEEDNCHCEKGIIKSAVHHTLNIFAYIFILTLVVNILVNIIGEDTLKNLMANTKFFEPIFSALIGLIPNCASSVIITELYLSNIIRFGSLIAGLLVNAGTRAFNII